MGNKLIRLHMDTAVALVSPGVRLTLPVGVYRRQWRHRVLIEGRLGRHPCQEREREDKIVHDSAEIIYRDEFNFEWV